MILKIVGIVAAALVLLVIAAGVGMYFGFIPNPFISLFLKPPGHSARYYPEDTLAYAWLTLYPSDGQQADMQDIWERLNEFRAFRDLVDDLKEELEDETDINFEEDVKPWIGPEMSAGILEVGRNADPTTAVTVEVRDKDSALIFLDQWLDYQEDTEGADFDADSYLSYDTWVDSNAGQAYALSEELLLIVFAEEEPEDTLEEMMGLISDESKPSLADAPDFQAARAALSSDRFVSVYVNFREALEIAGDLSAEWDDVLAQAGASDWPDWFVASVKWVGRGIVMEAISPDEEGPFRSLDNPAKLLSDTTLAFVAFEDDYDLDAWREEWSEPYGTSLDAWMFLFDVLSELTTVGEPFGVSPSIDTGEYDADIAEAYRNLYWLAEFRMDNPPRRVEDPDLNDVMDLGLELVQEETGIDLESDFFDYLEGETIIAINEFDFDDVEKDPVENPLDAVLMIQHYPDREEELDDTMGNATEAIEDYGEVDSDPANVGADNHARIFEIGGYSPGYVLHDGYLTIGTTRNALETTVTLQNGDSVSLDSVAEYLRIAGHLPEERALVAWVNLNAIFSQLDNEDTDLTRGQHRLLRETFGHAAASYHSDGSFSRVNFVLTLFPE